MYTGYFSKSGLQEINIGCEKDKVFIAEGFQMEDLAGKLGRDIDKCNKLAIREDLLKQRHDCKVLIR